VSEIILAIETSTEQGSIALKRGESLWCVALDNTLPASASLMPSILNLVADAGIALADVDVFVYGDGPGAFTGLRTACATAQALALPGRKPVLGVCTLAAVAAVAAMTSMASEAAKQAVWVQLDARMGEWYAAAYLDGQELLSPEVAKLEHLSQPPLDCLVVHNKPTAQGLLLAMHGYERVRPEQAGLRYVRNKVALTEKERGLA
jgi:tRNA threonylcarbamoyl adenosine modification protein YeaZ